MDLKGNFFQYQAQTTPYAAGFEVEKAAGEYKKYKERTLSDVEQDYLNSIKMLGKKADKDKKRVAHEAIIN